MVSRGSLGIGQMASLACILEVTIPKPGNVHRGADFADTSLQDFLTSAIAIGPVLDKAGSCPLGETILRATRATRELVSVNTNLGIILLMAPLAAVSVVERSSIARLLAATDAGDCAAIYAAIRLASPGGLGKANAHDISDPDMPSHILPAMRAAADRDLIARQYVNSFEDVLEFVLPEIDANYRQGMTLTDAVIRAHLATMCRYPDSLIARKCGAGVAEKAAVRAGSVLESGTCDSQAYLTALEAFDFWLRSEGNRRNPGCTADMIAAALFAGLRLARPWVPGSRQ